MIVAQISDLHIRAKGQLAYRRVDTAMYLKRCVEQLVVMTPRPDLVLATGDLVDVGHPDEYRHLRVRRSRVPAAPRLLSPLRARPASGPLDRPRHAGGGQGRRAHVRGAAGLAGRATR